MEIVRSFRDVPGAARGGVVTIGNFDGVHRGHQAVIAEVRTLAAKIGAPSIVMLFDPHPRAFFQPDKPLFTLTPMPERLDLLAGLGLDFAAVLPFDAAMAGLSAQDFAAKVLAKGFEARHVVVGYDFNFGKGRTGNAQVLKDLGGHLGFGVSVQPPEQDAHSVYSSSRVREMLRKGDVAGAARQLGREWRIGGTVITGAGVGRNLGYPTANIPMPPGTELAHGIYAARVLVDGMTHPAVAYYGRRPTFDGGSPGFEVFLLNFNANLYDKPLKVDLIAFIRGDHSFPDAAALSAQMGLDVAEALKHHGPGAGSH
jgi:riboflavin kinase / FMN adenylyltransferase